MNTTSAFAVVSALASTLVATACSSDASDPGGTDAAVSGSACTPDQSRMSGAFEVNTPSVATVKVAGTVVGVGGFGTGSPPTTYAFTLVDVLHGELATVGPHDVAAANLKYLAATEHADCQMPGMCNGFIAASGTYEVLEATPRYRATFTLAGLHAYDGSSTVLGAPIAGQVTGCIDAP
ncbi:MAG: hypothetical protein IPQ07_23965 [Myxococcales bacterium]|nr:hypothetical protein [Myxococcales bacterium]